MTCWRSCSNRTALAVLLLVGTACASTVLPPPERVPRSGAPRIAIMPVTNLSGGQAPVRELRHSLAAVLAAAGTVLLDDRELERFMARHRVRYTGGIDAETGKALKDETGCDAVLIASIEAAGRRTPPQFALAARLVSTGGDPAVLWADSRAMAGDDAPGLLGLGLIEQPAALQEKVVQSLAASLLASLAGEAPRVDPVPELFGPRRVYRSAVLDPSRKYRVAIIPFQNQTDQAYAGEILGQEFIAAMQLYPGHFEVIEPGIVRSKMLRFRLIMEQGISLANADVLFEILQADLILTGTVYEYEEDQGAMVPARTGISPLLLERSSRAVVWSSSSYNRGDDNVYVFDVGRVSTAAGLVRLCSRATVQGMMKRSEGRGSTRPAAGAIRS